MLEAIDPAEAPGTATNGGESRFEMNLDGDPVRRQREPDQSVRPSPPSREILHAAGQSIIREEGAMATIVLVHGAWGGGWIWKKVIPLLRAAGHDVYATTATGMGDRVHLAGPAVDLDTHIADVVNVLGVRGADRRHTRRLELRRDDHHRGGGAGAGAPGAVGLPRRPGAGRRRGRLRRRASSGEVSRRRPCGGEAAGMPGFLIVDPYLEWLRSLTPDPADQAWLLAKLVPQPLATYTQPIRLGNPAAAAVPRAFVFCTEGKDAEWTSSGAPRRRVR